MAHKNVDLIQFIICHWGNCCRFQRTLYYFLSWSTPQSFGGDRYKK